MQIYRNGNRWSVDVFNTNWYYAQEDRLYIAGIDPYEEGKEGTMIIYKRPLPYTKTQIELMKQEEFNNDVNYLTNNQ